jgi:hypothetical protein
MTTFVRLPTAWTILSVSSVVSTGIPRISRQSHLEYCSISLIDSACCCTCNSSCLTESFIRLFSTSSPLFLSSRVSTF